jgi:isopenicillin N synthase-like dioxygenase
MLKEIPVVTGDERCPEFVQTVGQAFRDIGFVFLREPELTAKLPRIYAEFKRTFDLPYWVKAQYARPEIFYQRGWTPPFTEEAIACRAPGNGKKKADAKENWFMGPVLAAGHPLKKQYPGLYADNIWPEEAPGLNAAMAELYADLDRAGRKILVAVEQFLNFPEGFFEGVLCDAPSVMRAIHYPPVTADMLGNIVWGCMHTDINLVTVLPPSTRSGLRIRRRDGEWIPGAAPADCVIVQVADMLDYLTGGELMSAAHEVKAPERPTLEGRISAAHFMHARSDVKLEPKVDGPDAAAYPPIAAGDLLYKRLKAIGLAN